MSQPEVQSAPTSLQTVKAENIERVLAHIKRYWGARKSNRRSPHPLSIAGSTTPLLSSSSTAQASTGLSQDAIRTTPLGTSAELADSDSRPVSPSSVSAGASAEMEPQPQFNVHIQEPLQRSRVIGASEEELAYVEEHLRRDSLEDLDDEVCSLLLNQLANISITDEDNSDECEEEARTAKSLGGSESSGPKSSIQMAMACKIRRETLKRQHYQARLQAMNTFVQRLRTIISERVQEVTDLQQRVVALEVANARLRGEPSAISSLHEDALKVLKRDLSTALDNVDAALEKESISVSPSDVGKKLVGGSGDSTSRGMAMCTLCEENPIDVFLRPCGHACMCESCLARLPRAQCPICRKTIKKARRVFLC
mmetsp:Transcript_3787/g.13534  ORF Transcript_3787/g.13534 Transcript_3787/m.13534 type:complete len:368 (-) Transcript_3787:899-2002(-)